MIIAVASENEEVFQHFGHTPEFTIFEIENGSVKNKQAVSTEGEGHGALAKFLLDHGVDLLICGGIGAGAQKALADEGIKLVAGVSGKVEGAMSGYLNGTLEFRTDFTCSHHHGDHAHGEGHACGGHGHGEGPSCGGGCKH